MRLFDIQDIVIYIMSHTNRLVRGRQPTYSRSSSTNTRDYTSSPSVEPPAWAPHLSGVSLTSAYSRTFCLQPSLQPTTHPTDLFSTLLFDRETAYHGSTPAVLLSRSALPEPISQQHGTRKYYTSYSSNPYIPAVTPSQKPARPATITHTASGDDMTATSSLKEKAREKTTVSTKKAKSAVKSKAKTPANKKKVIAKSDGKAAPQAVAVVRKRTAPKSESSPERPTKAAKRGSRTSIGRKVDSKKANTALSGIIEISDTECDTQSETRNMLRHTRQQTWAWSDSVVMKQDESAATTNPIINEVQKLRKELDAAQNKTKSLQADLEKSKVTAQLDQEKMKTKYESNIAKLTKDLNSEKQLVNVVTQQREELRAQLQLHQEDSAKYTNLKINHDALKARWDAELNSHAEILQDVLKNSETAKTQVTALQATNQRLTNEIKTLKSLKFVPPPSPAPSSAFSFSSDEERREENVRKMYVKTKRQFDDLTAATKDLMDCTKGMDLSSFGDFGRCVKRMKTAVEPENGVVERRVDGVGEADDEDGWRSQR